MPKSFDLKSYTRFGGVIEDDVNGLERRQRAREEKEGAVRKKG
jgi:hypothetical protein